MSDSIFGPLVFFLTVIKGRKTAEGRRLGKGSWEARKEGRGDFLGRLLRWEHEF